MTNSGCNIQSFTRPQPRSRNGRLFEKWLFGFPIRQDFAAQLDAAIELEEKLASESVSNGSKLKAERADLEQQAIRLADAIGQHGYSSVLSAQLSKVESRMVEIDRLLTAKPASKLPKFTDEQIREFLRQECKDFCDAQTSDPEFARQEIQKRIKKLVLTPKETPEGWVPEVTGDVALLRTGCRVSTHCTPWRILLEFRSN